MFSGAGWADRFGRRWSMIIPALIALAFTPTYLLTTDFLLDRGRLHRAVGLFAGGGMYGQIPST